MTAPQQPVSEESGENQALQERADRAEALLRRIWKEGLYEDQTSGLIEAFFGPTQETDPRMSDEKPVIWFYRERRKAQSLYELSRCNEKVAAWKYVQPMRCNLARGHAGECDHVEQRTRPTQETDPG